MIFEGRCWLFGDGISCDGDILPHNLVFGSRAEPEKLRSALFVGLDPSFATKVSPGDLVVVGRRFGTGHPHARAAQALAAAGVGVIAGSITGGHKRNLIGAGVPLLTGADAVREIVEPGDRLRVNFGSGEIVNVHTGRRAQATPLPAGLIAIVDAGGWKEMLRVRLSGEAAACSPGGLNESHAHH